MCSFSTLPLLRCLVDKAVDCCHSPANDGENSRVIIVLRLFCLSTCKVAAEALEVQPVNLPLHPDGRGGGVLKTKTGNNPHSPINDTKQHDHII